MNASSDIKPSIISKRTDALIQRVEQSVNAMLSRLQSIIELSSIDTELNPTASAASALQIRSYATQLINASEDLRTLVREVKEIWLLSSNGELNSKLSQEQADQESEKEVILSASEATAIRESACQALQMLGARQVAVPPSS